MQGLDPGPLPAVAWLPCPTLQWPLSAWELARRPTHQASVGREAGAGRRVPSLRAQGRRVCDRGRTQGTRLLGSRICPVPEQVGVGGSPEPGLTGGGRTEPQQGTGTLQI